MPLPCDALPANPPSVADIEADPPAEAMTQAVIALAPRGPAWGTDEAGDGRGASPNQMIYWGRIGAAFAELYRLAFGSAVQAHPSAISTALDEWETELGLPDPCSAATSIEQRVLAVRTKFAAAGGSSPDYFVCVARAAGFTITIEEPSGFECNGSVCGGDDELVSSDPEQIWIIRAEEYRMFEFELGEGGGTLGDGATRLVDYTDISGLECVIRPISPLHTELHFLAL